MTHAEIDAAIREHMGVYAPKVIVDYDRAFFRAGMLAAAEVLEAFDVYDSTVAACANAIRAAAGE